MVLAVSALVIFNLWGYEPISWSIVFKAIIMLIIFVITSLLSYFLYLLFIKKYSDSKKSDKRVKPLN